ncbi:hypothetical protein PENFLA_c044G08449 [Penicillium flavigenum]|uniref:Uncharacterized protein n=1 Tax=Penicillium flavigenum TaxID=254877 RepID=A0A1V6SIX7_9EURO|nr:hypothetical protein PENFLA_c044G08449 [Penicillium flavigenum]
MAGISDSSAFLARWRGRWSRLRLRQLLRIDEEEAEDQEYERELWGRIGQITHDEPKTEPSVIPNELKALRSQLQLSRIPVSGYDSYVASMKKRLAESRPIPVPTDVQLEQLAHLQYRALQRKAECRRIHEFVDRAIANLEAVMVGIPDTGLLTRWRGRWERLRVRRLRRIDEEEEEDGQVEQQIWSQIV